MEVIPAIDLRAGKVVRLEQGDFARETAYSADPEAVARRFAEAGAPRLHVVDLDGARDGRPQHLKEIDKIVRAARVPVQAGGGLRSLEAVRAVLDVGVGRVVLGTSAVEDPELVQRLVDAFGHERIAVGLDARDGKVAVAGWRTATTVDASVLLRGMAAVGVTRFVYTDISRDGTLGSPNFAAIAGIVRAASAVPGPDGQPLAARIIASGGVRDLEDMRRLAATGAEGAIIGSALYKGTLDLATAVREQTAGGGPR